MNLNFSVNLTSVGGGQISFLTTLDVMSGDALPKKVGDVAWLQH